MTEAEYGLLSRIEHGESVFRLGIAGSGGSREGPPTIALLLDLRSRGWIHLPDSRISRDSDGRVLLAGPCDLTEAGRQALEQDRRLGPRA